MMYLIVEIVACLTAGIIELLGRKFRQITGQTNGGCQFGLLPIKKNYFCLPKK